MPKVAVLGEKDAVLGFKASGAVVFAVNDVKEARSALSEVLGDDYAILLVTEGAAQLLRPELEPLYREPKPVVTVLPDARGLSSGVGMELLRRRVERAVGANILFKREG